MSEPAAPQAPSLREAAQRFLAVFAARHYGRIPDDVQAALDGLDTAEKAAAVVGDAARWQELYKGEKAAARSWHEQLVEAERKLADVEARWQAIRAELPSIIEGVREAVNCRKAQELGCDCRVGAETALVQLEKVAALIPPEAK